MGWSEGGGGTTSGLAGVAHDTAEFWLRGSGQKCESCESLWARLVEAGNPTAAAACPFYGPQECTRATPPTFSIARDVRCGPVPARSVSAGGGWTHLREGRCRTAQNSGGLLQTNFGAALSRQLLRNRSFGPRLCGRRGLEGGRKRPGAQGGTSIRGCFRVDEVVAHGTATKRD